MEDKSIRSDGRAFDALRPVHIERGFIKYPEGSVLIECGDTRIIINASWQSGVPRWLRGRGQGWITAEYSMLPRATQERNVRPVHRGKLSGRAQEIQRLIGRSLRSVVELDRLGENTVWVDCDVIQADGGTRTLSITGAFVALIDAFYAKIRDGELEYAPLNNTVAAVSCGIVGDNVLLDLAYDEDAHAQVDLNVVGTGDGNLVEVQGAAEGSPFTSDQLDRLMQVAQNGIDQLTDIQQDALGQRWDEVRVGIARLDE